jgi:hypothetical protein
VFLEGGASVPVAASGFEHDVNSEERITFIDADGKPIDEIFVRAKDIAMIIPDSRIAKSHAFSSLQNQIKTLTERMDRIELAQASIQPSSGSDA